jgi:hypothetical protein
VEPIEASTSGEDSAEESDGSTCAPEPPLIVTVEDFGEVDIEAPIRELCVADPARMCSAYSQSAVAVSKDGNSRAQRVYSLLSAVCGINLRPSNQAAPWVPMWTLASGTRSATPDDFRGAQTEAFSSIVSRIENPGLRARIADIAWCNNRRDGRSAAAAIDAYCDCVVRLLNGTLGAAHGHATPSDAYPLMHRAMLLSKLSTSRNRRPPRVAETFEVLYRAAREQGDVTTFVRLTDIALEYSLREANVAAADLEAVASSTPVGTFPIAVKMAWDLAARLYHNVGDKGARQRCLKGIVEQLLAMREHVKGAAAAEANWIEQALLVLRHVDGMEDLEHGLEIELKRLQKASLKQMGSMEIDLQLEGIPERVAELFGQLSLSESLKRFAFVTKSRDPEKLRAEALEQRREAPLMSMMPFSHVDGAGRTESKSAGAPNVGEPDETWYFRIIGQSERIRRARMVRGCIEPARAIAHARFGISERHFNAIVGLSVFIPEEQKPIMALGFTRFFQGDFMSAAYVLIPQLEPCLRHLLKIIGIDPSKRRDDGTEEDLSLGVLLTRFRTQLEKIIPAAAVFEINLLFNAKPGPELRHEMAHGQISAGACFSDDLVYAGWFLFHLCCMFVLADWEQIVTPQLAEDE